MRQYVLMCCTHKSSSLLGALRKVEMAYPLSALLSYHARCILHSIRFRCMFLQKMKGLQWCAFGVYAMQRTFDPFSIHPVAVVPNHLKPYRTCSDLVPNHWERLQNLFRTPFDHFETIANALQTCPESVPNAFQMHSRPFPMHSKTTSRAFRKLSKSIPKSFQEHSKSIPKAFQAPGLNQGGV